jgi:hypothetical protein
VRKNHINIQKFIRRKSLNSLFRDFLFITLCLIIFSNNTKADIFDSIRSSLKHKPQLDLRLDSRNSFVASRRAEIAGVKLGLEFNKRFRAGIGYSYLNEGIYNGITVGSRQDPRWISRKLVMRYFSVYADYVYFETKRWSFGVPVQLGIGTTFYREIFPRFNDFDYPSYPVILYEPCLSGEYRILDWFGFSANAGFRIVLYKNGNITERLTAPIYVVGASIYYSRLWRKVFPNKSVSDVIFGQQKSP